MKHQYDKQEIAQLIDKFMAGTTSIAEEDVLAQYFRTHEVGEEWTVYKEMFALFDAGKVDVEEETETAERLATPQRAKIVTFKKRDKQLGEPYHTSTASRWIWPAVAACMVAVFFLGRTSKGVDEQVVPQPVATGTKVIYASASDTAYQSPALVDEFIVKLAGYYGVEQEVLDGASTIDAGIISYTYVFPHQKQVDVFARLLQVACWYNNDCPGYQLRLSQDQFLFELNDTHEGRHHMWLAEKIGNNTFLYSVNTPIGTTFSNASYINFRDKHTPLNKKYLYYKL